MFRGYYKAKQSSGIANVYNVGDTILFEGSVYKAKKSTTKSPFEDKKTWKFIGITEIYQSNTPPINPVVGQHWEKEGKLYIYYKDVNGFSWVEV